MASMQNIGDFRILFLLKFNKYGQYCYTHNAKCILCNILVYLQQYLHVPVLVHQQKNPIKTKGN